MTTEMRCQKCGAVHDGDSGSLNGGDWTCPDCGHIQSSGGSEVRQPADTENQTLLAIGRDGATDGDGGESSESGDGDSVRAPVHDGTLFSITGDTGKSVRSDTRPPTSQILPSGSDVPPPTAIERAADAATVTIRQTHGVVADVTIGRDTTVQRLLTGSGNVAERHVIGDEIARGGMGSILSVVDRDLRREVAMKVMLPAAARDAERVLRFVEEAQVTGQLSHPNIVPVHELGVSGDGRIYFTMKRVRGHSLAEVIRALRYHEPKAEAKYTLTLRLGIFRQVGQAVAFAHANGVIHRDLKPDNVMVGDFGEVLVMDWGLARVSGQTERHAGRLVITDRSDSMEETAHTLDGTVAGTPAYMSPEQAEGTVDQIDERSDVWALGAILHEMISLRPAFTGRNAWDIIKQVKAGGFTLPGEKEGDPPVPRELQAIVRKAMTRDKAKRYQSVGDLIDDVENFLEGRTLTAASYTTGQVIAKWMHRHRKAVIPSAVAAVLLVALGLWFVISTLTKNAEIRRQHAEIEAKARDLERQRDAARVAEVEAELQREEAQRALAQANRNLADSLTVRAQQAINQNDPLSAAVFLARARELAADSQRLRALELLLPRPVASWITRMRIHGGDSGSTVTYTPDCRKLMVAGADHRIVTLDPRTGDQQHEHQLTAGEGEEALTPGLVWWSPDSRRYAIRSQPGTVDFYDAETHDRIYRTTAPENHKFADRATFDDNGRLVGLLYGEDPLYAGAVRYIDLDDGFESDVTVDARPNHNGILAFEFRPGTRDLTFAWQDSIFAWDPRAPIQRPFPTLSVKGMINTFSWHPDGMRIVIVERGQKIYLRDRMSTQAPWFEIPGYVHLVASSPDGRLIALGNSDGTVRLLNSFGEELAVLGGHQWVQSMCFSPDGQRLAVGTRSGDLVLWAIHPPPDGIEHGDPRVSTLSTDGRYLVMGVDDWTPGALQVLDLETGREVFLPALRDEVTAPALLRPGTKWLSMAMRFRGMIRLVHLETGAVRFLPMKSGADSMVWNRSGEWITTQVQSVEALQVSPDGDLVGHITPDFGNPINAGAVNPAGTGLLVCDWEARTMFLPIPGDGTPKWTVNVGSPMGFGIVWSPDGKRVAVASHSGLRLLAHDGSVVHELGGQLPPPRGAYPLAFTPDGALLISGSDTSTSTAASSSDAFVRVHDAVTGVELARIAGRAGNMLETLALTPDGRTLVTASAFGTVRINGGLRQQTLDEAERHAGMQLDGLELRPLDADRVVDLAARFPVAPLDPVLADFWRAQWQASRRFRANSRMVAGTIAALRASVAAEWLIERAARWHEEMLAVHGEEHQIVKRLVREMESARDSARQVDSVASFGNIAAAMRPVAEWLAANPDHPYADRARMLLALAK